MNKIEKLETRIKELEIVIDMLKSQINNQNQINFKLDQILIRLPQQPVGCEHDWQYNYNTTSPNRTCKKCYAYEMLQSTYTTYNSTFLVTSGKNGSIGN